MFTEGLAAYLEDTCQGMNKCHIEDLLLNTQSYAEMSLHSIPSFIRMLKERQDV